MLKRISNKRWFYFISPSLALFVFFWAASAAAAQRNKLQVRKIHERHEHHWLIKNRFYEAALNPAEGAFISSFRMLPDGTEVAFRGRSEYSGLLGEALTAGMQYELVDENVSREEATFTFAADRGELTLQKSFTFQSESPIITLALSVENRSGSTLRNVTAPALLSTFSVSQTPSERYFYALGRSNYAEVHSMRAILRRYNYLNRADDLPVHWTAVISPVDKIGVGMLHLDSAVQSVLAGRHLDGPITLESQLGPVEPFTKYTTEVKLFPLRGFSSVDLISEDLIAESLMYTIGEHRKLFVRVKSLIPEPREISIVTRAFNADGEELGPLETIVFDSLDMADAAVETVNVDADMFDNLAWVGHEVYSNGRRLHRFLSVPPGAEAHLTASGSELPPPHVEKLEKYHPEGAVDHHTEEVSEARAEDDESIYISKLKDAEWVDVEKFDLIVEEDDSRTVIFKLGVSGDIKDLQIGLVGPAEGDGNGEALRPLSATSVFLWEVPALDAPDAELRPFRRRDLSAGDSAFAAVTLNSAELDTGEYAARIVLSSKEKTVELPINVEVIAPVPVSEEAVKLWYLTDTADDSFEAIINTAMRYGFRAVSVKPGGTADRYQARHWAERARSSGVVNFGFYDPGLAIVGAERISDPLIGQGMGSETAPLTWLACMRSDGPQVGRLLRDMGFAPAAIIPRTTPALVSKVRAQESFSDILLGGQMGDVMFDLEEAIQEKGYNGSQRYWRYIDVRDYDLVELSGYLRREFFHAVAIGARGVAVRADVPESSPGRSLFLHLLRDAWQDAAAFELLIFSENITDSLRCQYEEMIGYERYEDLNRGNGKEW